MVAAVYSGVPMLSALPICTQVVPQRPEDSPVVAAIYSSVLGQTIGSEAARALFHTQYHRREKTLAAAAGDW